MNALRRLARKFGHFFVPQPSVPAEQIVRLESAIRTRAPRRAYGWLVLTDEELIFERTDPMFSPLRLLSRWVRAANFSVKLADIAAVSKLPGDYFDRAPFLPILAFTVESGEGYFVQLMPVTIDAWVDALNEIIARNHQTADPSAH